MSLVHIDLTPRVVAGQFHPEDEDGRTIHISLTPTYAALLHSVLKEELKRRWHTPVGLIDNVLEQLLQHAK